jgi:hypothetical protein
MGDAAAKPPVCSTSTSAASPAMPVSSRASPSRATVANQSPAKLISCAAYSRAKAGFSRSSLT